MLACVHSSVTYGAKVVPVSVEVDISAGLPGFAIVGLPDRVIRESVVRVRSALKHSGFRMPRRKVVVNLAPADIPKEGPVLDLPIALGVLVASGQLDQKVLEKRMIVGELALDGSLCGVRGVLPRVIHLAQMKGWSCMVPQANAIESYAVEEVPALAVSSLTEAVTFLTDPKPIENYKKVQTPQIRIMKSPALDFADVKGQMQVKRGLLVAASGGHNVLMVGPPGVGKTMLACCLPGILGGMTHEETLQTSQIHSLAGFLTASSGLVKERPFRAPHHNASTAALVGGGAGIPHPGEVSLAHNGVLFLDELPEFRRDALEVLRQPIEEGEARIARSKGNFTFPARFMLVAAMNPCSCGYFGTDRECVCSDVGVKRYRSRLSGPLLDRMDVHLYVPPLKMNEIVNGNKGQTSDALCHQVNRCRIRQTKRYQNINHGTLLNAHLKVQYIEHFCKPDSAGLELLRRAVDEMGLSARAYHRVLKVARTIADLDDSEGVKVAHIAEAIGYRLLDRKLQS